MKAGLAIGVISESKVDQMVVRVDGIMLDFGNLRLYVVLWYRSFYD